ncbi:hypothetical protein Agub_g12500 [Astrephomene gubernaculifera]|uniref:Uncharacterized protein n=1 Tax=Astrephomene gubernaculifera TaxID=47775 RepID=A0AAD3DYR8_9CHLO|nr:hypothetical protein Agub_g12500 [Astrephomene gubernaculifera]
MAGTKAAKAGVKAPSKHTAADGATSPSSSPRVVAEELMALLRRGNASAIKRWLKSGGDVHQIAHVPQLDKPWGYASPAAAAAAAAAASSSSAPPPAPPPGHWPLILLACAVSSAGVVEALLKAGADPNVRNLYGLTALVAAVHNDGLAGTEKLALAKLLHRHGFTLFGCSCEAHGERATAGTALLHQLALADPEDRAAAAPLLDWLLQHEGLPAPSDPPLFQHLCFSLALDPAALPLWLPILSRRTAYVLGSPSFAELVVGVVAAAHQLRDARATAQAQALAASGAAAAAAAAARPGLAPLDGVTAPGGGGVGRQGVSGLETQQQPKFHPLKHGSSSSIIGGGAGMGNGLGSSSNGGSEASYMSGAAAAAASGPYDVSQYLTNGSGSSSSNGNASSARPAQRSNGSSSNGGSVTTAAASSGSGGGGAVRTATATVAAREALLAARERERERERAAERSRGAVRARAAAAAAAAAAEEAEAEAAAGGGRGDEALALRAFLDFGLNPNEPMCADGLLPMQRFLEKPELLGVLLEGGMDPRVRAGVAPLDLTFLHSYALIGRFQSASEASVQACSLLLGRDPGLLWLRCAGLTACDLALAHCNLALAEYLAPLMGREQQQAAAQLRRRMMSFPCGEAGAAVAEEVELEEGKKQQKSCVIKVEEQEAAAAADEEDDDDLGFDVSAFCKGGCKSSCEGGGLGVEEEGDAVTGAAVAAAAGVRRVWDPSSPAAAAAAVAAAAACGSVTIPGQDAEVAASYRLLCLALQRPELWDNDMSGLMRQVPLMDIRQILTLLDVLNSRNLFNVVTFLEHCRTFAQRVILQVLQLGSEGHDLMAAVVPPPAVAAALTFLRAHPDNLWLQSVAKYFPPLVDAMVAAEDTRELMRVAPQQLLAMAPEVSRLPPDLVQAACESARAAMLLENGFHSPRPQLDDLEGPLRQYASAGYHRLLLKLLLALPAASKQVWHDLHVMAYLPEVCAEVALQLCTQPRLTQLLAEALAVVRACMAGRPAAEAEAGGADAAVDGQEGSKKEEEEEQKQEGAASYSDAVTAVVAHLAAHLGGMAAAGPPPPPPPQQQQQQQEHQQQQPAAADPVLPPAPSSTSSSAALTALTAADSCDCAVQPSSRSGSSTGAGSSSSSGTEAEDGGSSSSPASSGASSRRGSCGDLTTTAAAAADTTSTDTSSSAPAAPASASTPCNPCSSTPSPSTSSSSPYPPELTYLEDVVVEQTDLLQSLYALMALCSLTSHLLAPDFGLAMCSREFRSRMTGIPDSAVDELAAKHGPQAGAAGGAAAAAAGAAAATASPSSSAAAATAAAILAAYPRSGGLSLDQLYAQLLGNMTLGGEQKELVESRREFLKQVLAMDATWRALSASSASESSASESSAAAATPTTEAEQPSSPPPQQHQQEVNSSPTASSAPPPAPLRRPLRDPELVAAARRAVLNHPVIWPAVQAVAALPAAPGPRPGVRVLWDDDNTPIYVLMSLAARRAVETAAALPPQQQL